MLLDLGRSLLIVPADITTSLIQAVPQQTTESVVIKSFSQYDTALFIPGFRFEESVRVVLLREQMWNKLQVKLDLFLV